MGRQIQHRRLVELIVDLGLEKLYCLGNYQNKTKQQQNDILPLLAVEKQYSFTLVNFKDPVIY